MCYLRFVWTNAKVKYIFFGRGAHSRLKPRQAAGSLESYLEANRRPLWGAGILWRSQKMICAPWSCLILMARSLQHLRCTPYTKENFVWPVFFAVIISLSFVCCSASSETSRRLFTSAQRRHRNDSWFLFPSIMAGEMSSFDLSRLDLPQAERVMWSTSWFSFWSFIAVWR